MSARAMCRDGRHAAAIAAVVLGAAAAPCAAAITPREVAQIA
jgi:hypothetical protein